MGPSSGPEPYGFLGPHLALKWPHGLYMALTWPWGLIEACRTLKGLAVSPIPVPLLIKKQTPNCHLSPQDDDTQRALLLRGQLQHGDTHTPKFKVVAVVFRPANTNSRMVAIGSLVRYAVQLTSLGNLNGPLHQPSGLLTRNGLAITAPANLNNWCVHAR